MDPRKEREERIKAARDIAQKAQAESRSMTAEEISTFDEHMAKADELAVTIKAGEESQARIKAVANLGPFRDESDEPVAGKSLGEQFANFLKGSGQTLLSKGSIAGPEFKAATDTIAVGGMNPGPVLTDVDRSVVLPYREAPVVGDLISWGTVNGTAITYPVFGPLQGGTGTVAEGGQKPQMSVGPLDWKTDSLAEIAGWFKMTDDMAEDMAWLMTEINTTALYDLSMKEEAQLLNGNGTAPNLRGILNRSGIQTVTQQSGETALDAIYRAMVAVQTASGFPADGVVVNPVDHQGMRLGKDANGQYYGGGPFYAPYGNGGLQWELPVWGRKTVVTTATPAKQAIVAAWRTIKGFRKGGIRVESTNSHQDDFTNDKITVRVRERVGLQVKYPAAIAKVVLL